MTKYYGVLLAAAFVAAPMMVAVTPAKAQVVAAAAFKPTAIPNFSTLPGAQLKSLELDLAVTGSYDGHPYDGPTNGKYSPAVPAEVRAFQEFYDPSGSQPALALRIHERAQSEITSRPVIAVLVGPPGDVPLGSKEHGTVYIWKNGKPYSGFLRGYSASWVDALLRGMPARPQSEQPQLHGPQHAVDGRWPVTLTVPRDYLAWVSASYNGAAIVDRPRFEVFVLPSPTALVTQTTPSAIVQTPTTFSHVPAVLTSLSVHLGGATYWAKQPLPVVGDVSPKSTLYCTSNCGEVHGKASASALPPDTVQVAGTAAYMHFVVHMQPTVSSPNAGYSIPGVTGVHGRRRIALKGWIPTALLKTGPWTVSVVLDKTTLATYQFGATLSLTVKG